jgi:hypothetical protein
VNEGNNENVWRHHIRLNDSVLTSFIPFFIIAPFHVRGSAMSLFGKATVVSQNEHRGGCPSLAS